MPVQDDYGSCCRLTAACQRDAVFCPDCGRPLFRCPASGCGTLVAPLAHCPACIDLRLWIDKGAMLAARAGGCVSVPFVLRNNSSIRSLSLRTVLREAADVPRAAVPLAWEQLEPGRERTFVVPAGPFAHAGIAGLRLTLVVRAASGDIEETYAFSGNLSIDVESAQAAAGPRVDLTGATFGTGGSVIVRSDVSAEPRRLGALEARVDVALERAERFEIEQGLRGYQGSAVRVPRDVEFVFVGFPASDRPPDGPLLQQPVVRCGRNGRVGQVPPNTEANDLCLRIYDPASGELDREASGGISRRACDFAVSDDRLSVRSMGGAGVVLNGEHVAPGETRAVGSGDSLTVPAGGGKAVTLRTTFKVSAGRVARVQIEKK